MHYNTFSTRLKKMGFTKEGYSYSSHWYKNYRGSGAESFVQIRLREYNFAIHGHDFGIADMTVMSKAHNPSVPTGASFDRPAQTLELANDLIAIEREFGNWDKHFAEMQAKYEPQDLLERGEAGTSGQTLDELAGGQM